MQLPSRARTARKPPHNPGSRGTHASLRAGRPSPRRPLRLPTYSKPTKAVPRPSAAIPEAMPKTGAAKPERHYLGSSLDQYLRAACSYLHEHISSRPRTHHTLRPGHPSKLQERPPRPIREPPLPTHPSKQDATLGASAWLRGVAWTPIWAQWPEVVKTIEDRRADVVDLSAGSQSLQIFANMPSLGPRVRCFDVDPRARKGRWHQQEEQRCSR